MHMLQKKSLQKATSFLVAFSIVISLMPRVAYATEIEEDSMPTEPTTYVVDESGDVVSAYVDTNTPDIVNTESEFIDEKVDEADSICAAEEEQKECSPETPSLNEPESTPSTETPEQENTDTSTVEPPEEKSEDPQEPIEEENQEEIPVEPEKTEEELLLSQLLDTTEIKEFIKILLDKAHEALLNKLSEKDIEDLLKFVDEEFKNEQEYMEIIDFIYELENAPEKNVIEPVDSCAECGAIDTHTESCSQYVQPEIPTESPTESTETPNSLDKEIVERDVVNEDTPNGNLEEEMVNDEEFEEDHDVELVFCEECGSESEEHVEDCPTLINPVEALFEALMTSDSINAFWVIMMAEENREYVFMLSVEEITQLMEYVNTLYGAIENPTDDDTEYKDLLLETFIYLPAMECPECGEFGGHLDECPHYVEILINDPKNGMTLTADHSIGAQTLNSGSTITWTIPEGITLTITGTILLQKNTTLVITGGGTVLRKIDSTLFDIEDTCTLNLNGITVTGDGNSFQYPVAQTTADDKVSNIIINNTTIKNMTINGKSRGIITIFANSSNKGSRCNLTVTDSVFENCSTTAGGALQFQINTQSTVTITNSSFSGHSVTSGATILFQENAQSTMSMSNVTFNNCAATTGATMLFQKNTRCDVTINDSTFNGNSATTGAAMYFQGNTHCAMVVNNTMFSNNKTSQGGVVRTAGSSGISLRLNQCVFKNNTAQDSLFGSSYTNGAAIYWNACGSDLNGNRSHATIVDCQFLSNKVIFSKSGLYEEDGHGGAIYNEAFMTITSNYSSGFSTSEAAPGSIRGNLISNNSTTNLGGGIMVPTYSGGESAHNGYGAELTLDSSVLIVGNSAQAGGGVAMSVGTGSVGNGSSSSVDYIINCNGATISNNTASIMGGGVYLQREPDKDNYDSVVNLSSGTLRGNSAPKGGAIAVYNASNQNANHINEINIGSETDSLLIENNTSTQYGGAIYVYYGDVNLTNGTFQSNSSAYGGAVAVENGEFKMSGGTITNNTAAECGGAIYVANGNFTMYNGTFSYNEAPYGGAAQVTGGHVDIYNGTFDSNSAVHSGGAIYLDTEDVDVNIAIYDGVIVNNSTNEHGGAIGANTTNGAINFQIGKSTCTGAGADHDDDGCPLIENNTATNLGGAFCLHGDELSVNIYCGRVADNIAMQNPGSDNLNQSGGTITVYGGEIDSGLMIGGGEFIDNRVNAKQIIIQFWGNYNGAPSTPKTVRVTNGVTMSFPVDIYNRSGHFLTGWSTSSDASGIYVPANGQYTINTQVEVLNFYAVWDVESTYIVYIPDTMLIDENTNTGTMDITADLFYFLEMSTIDIRIQSDFVLRNERNSNDTIDFGMFVTEYGTERQLHSGDIAATFQYNNHVAKRLTAKIDTTNLKLSGGRYNGTLTFVVNYYVKDKN